MYRTFVGEINRKIQNLDYRGNYFGTFFYSSIRLLSISLGIFDKIFYNIEDILQNIIALPISKIFILKYELIQLKKELDMVFFISYRNSMIKFHNKE